MGKVLQDQEDKKAFESIISGTGELLFVLLPLIVIAIVSFSMGKDFFWFFSRAEWSFGASILFGQSMIKLHTNTQSIENRERLKSGNIQLMMVSLLIFGFIPSITILILLLIFDKPLLLWLIVQIILFILGALAFLYASGIKGISDAIKEDSDS